MASKIGAVVLGLLIVVAAFVAAEHSMPPTKCEKCGKDMHPMSKWPNILKCEDPDCKFAIDVL